MDALCTDLYQLTMAAGYFHRGMTGAVATCEMFVRRLPRHRRFLLAMGVERVLGYLEELCFTDEQIAYLREVPALRGAMTPEFVEALRRFRFTGDVFAVAEGTATFAGEPLLRVRAPILEAQIVETFILSAVNHATMVASKAARIVHAAGDAAVLELGTRRTHPGAAVDAARAAYAAGFAGTSNVEAGMRYGVPVAGTSAHMWVMAHATEEAAFEGYVAVFPDTAILLVDTYDTERGALRAASIAREKLRGVRLDSGDLHELSRRVRAILDANGCAAAKIIASGDLNEHRIAELRAAGAPIDVYGVGTDLVASVDAPALGGVYKLVELERDGVRNPVAKFSDGKATLPGAHQVFRHHDEGGNLLHDVIALEDEAPSAWPGSSAVHGLLAPVMRGGRRTSPRESLESVRGRAKRSLGAMPKDLLSLDDPEASGSGMTATLSPRLEALVASLRERYVSAAT